MADALRSSHPLWQDERVFQAARRVVIAQWQHITYSEYLPHLLGATAARSVTPPLADDDADADPTVSVEFAAAAFRFWQRPSRNETHVNDSSSASSTHSFLDILRRTSAASGGMFAPPESGPALELAAAEVLRGRDLGLSSYAAVRRLCSGQPVTDWADLEAAIDHQQLRHLRDAYVAPDDVDLWVGGMLERRAPQARVGATFQCVIGEQFRRLRGGDRLFYERSLSGAQLREVRKASLARLLCDNDEGRGAAPPRLLEPLSETNRMTACESLQIARVHLSVF